MKNILMYIWQLPQNLLGLLLVWYFRKRSNYFWSIDKPPCRVYVSDKMRGGISLGQYIILNTSLYHDRHVNHEWGHSVDSRRFGWFYLLIIGLPSILWAIFHGNRDYYSFYTERWADRNGGVVT